MKEKDLEQYNYSMSSDEPTKRVEKLREVMDSIRPLITGFDVGTLQTDSIYSDVTITYKQHEILFEVTNIEDND